MNGLILSMKIFDVIYLLAGIGFFSSGILNLFSENWAMSAIGFIFGVLITYIGYGNIKSWKSKVLTGNQNE